MVLDEEADIEVVAECADGLEAVDRIIDTGPGRIEQHRTDAVAIRFEYRDQQVLLAAAVALDRRAIAGAAADRLGRRRTFQTGLPAGVYCDVISNDFDQAAGTCSGPTITVDGSDNNKDWLKVTVNRPGAASTLNWTRVPYSG